MEIPPSRGRGFVAAASARSPTEADMTDVTEIAGLRNHPVARRGMLMTGLISGFTLATQRVEAQAIHTDETGIEAGATEIPTTDGNLPAYYAKPTGKGLSPSSWSAKRCSASTNTSRTCAGGSQKLAIAVATGTSSAIFEDDRCEADPQRGDSQGTRRPIYVGPGCHRCVGAATRRQRDTPRCYGLLPSRGGRRAWLYAHNPRLKAADVLPRPNRW